MARSSAARKLNAAAASAQRQQSQPKPLQHGRNRPGSKALKPPTLRPTQDAAPMRGEERDIVLGRIDKELVARYWRDGGECKHLVRAQLLLGLSEVARALERSGSGAAASLAVVILSVRDIKAPVVTEHILRLLRSKGIPHLLLPNASRGLSKLFGTKSMTAMAVRAHGAAPPQPPAEAESPALQAEAAAVAPTPLQAALASLTQYLVAKAAA